MEETCPCGRDSSGHNYNCIGDCETNKFAEYSDNIFHENPFCAMEPRSNNEQALMLNHGGAIADMILPYWAWWNVWHIWIFRKYIVRIFPQL